MRRQALLRCLEVVIVVAASYTLYTANGRTIAALDTKPARYLPFALLRDHTFYLDGYIASDGPTSPPFYVDEIHGHYVSDYPVGAALLATPFYAPAVWSGARPRRELCERLEKRAASAITALSVGVVHLAARELAPPLVALGVTAVYALGTSNWSVTSQALWQHGASELMIALAILAALRARRSERWLPVAGLALASAPVCRPTDVWLLAPLGLLVAYRHRDRWAWLAAGALPPLAFQLWYNVHYFDDLLHSQFPISGGPLWETPFVEGFLGLLFSPARGLFVYSPIFLFALAGFLGAWRRDGDAVVRALGIGVVVSVLLHARWFRWWGGWTYGPRLLADLSPALAIGLLAAWPRLSRGRVRSAAALVAALWSIGAHGLGAFAGDYGWNARPVSVDQTPERLWNWSDNQLVNSAFGLVRPTADRRRENELAWTFADEIALVGYEWTPIDEQSFAFAYRWQAKRRMHRDYAVFVHVEGPGGFRLQDDYSPGGLDHPTSSWAVGEIVAASRTIELPADAPPGVYVMRVGVWDPATRERLELGGRWFRRPAVDLFAFRVGESALSYSTRAFRRDVNRAPTPVPTADGSG